MRVGGDRVENTLDAVAVEHYLTIEFRGEPVATLACTPSRLEELALGHLIGQGMVPAAASPNAAALSWRLSVDRRVIRVAPAGGEPERPGEGAGTGGLVPSGCGAVQAMDQDDAVARMPAVSWDGTVPASRIAGLAALLEEASLFRRTGAAHSAVAAVAEGSGPEGVLVTREDIGRHNAVDKVVGHLWLAGLLPAQTTRAAVPGGRGHARILSTSGRISSDIVIKAARAGFPLVVSRGAPTVMAVRLAAAAGLTLAGFARGRRMNVYTHPGRVG